MHMQLADYLILARIALEEGADSHILQTSPTHTPNHHSYATSARHSLTRGSCTAVHADRRLRLDQTRLFGPITVPGKRSLSCQQKRGIAIRPKSATNTYDRHDTLTLRVIQKRRSTQLLIAVT